MHKQYIDVNFNFVFYFLPQGKYKSSESVLTEGIKNDRHVSKLEYYNNMLYNCTVWDVLCRAACSMFLICF